MQRSGLLAACLCVRMQKPIYRFVCVHDTSSVCVCCNHVFCVWFVTTNIVCVRVCSNKTIPDDKQAGTDCNSVKVVCQAVVAVYLLGQTS